MADRARLPDARQADAALFAPISRRLATFPVSGRIGRVEGTCELVVATTPFIVAYRIDEDGVDVLAVLHGARRRPHASD